MPLIHTLGTTVRVDLGGDIDPEGFTAAWSRCRTDDVDTGDEKFPLSPLRT